MASNLVFAMELLLDSKSALESACLKGSNWVAAKGQLRVRPRVLRLASQMDSS